MPNGPTKANGPIMLFGEDGRGCDTISATGCYSTPFTVTDHPVIIRAFNLEDDDKIFVEMVGGDNEGEFSEVMKSGCGCSVVLTGCNNTIVLSASGRYRLNRCLCQADPISPLAYVEYQPITTGAVVNYGEVSMACGCETGSEVTVTQPGDGSTILTVDGTPFVLPAPSPVVTVADLADTIVLTVGGVPYQIDKGPDTGVEIAALLALRNCAGNPINAGDSVVTCAELTAAVAAINATIAALPDVQLQSLQSYDPVTNTLVLEMSDGSTVPVNMTTLLNDTVQTAIDQATVGLTDAFGVPLANAFPA